MATKHRRMPTDVEVYTRINHRTTATCDGVKLCADILLPSSSSRKGNRAMDSPSYVSWAHMARTCMPPRSAAEPPPSTPTCTRASAPLDPMHFSELCDPLNWVRLIRRQRCYLLNSNPGHNAKSTAMPSRPPVLDHQRCDTGPIRRRSGAMQTKTSGGALDDSQGSLGFSLL